jgi:hypothetical protein
VNVLPRARRRTWVASGLTGVLTAGVVFALVVGPSVVIAAPARAADVASSAVTVTAKDQDPAGYQDAPFPDLAVTVSQTKNLRQQGVSVSWTGATGHASLPFTSSNGGRWFLQIFQCWGDDPTDPQRPDRTTCQYGGTAKYGATRDATRRYEYDAIPEKDKQYSVPRVSSFEGAYTSIPFVSRKGTVVSSITTAADGTKSRDLSVDVNNNTQFDANTTNEIRWAGSGADGTRSLSFEMQTTMQSPALGCGDPVTVDGSVEGASCWLVILPRPNADNGSSTINQSGLFWDSWKHALAVRIGFEPVGARCTVGAPERQLAGSEIAALAVQSWQPALCGRSGGAVYSHLTIAESDALTAASTTEDAPLALTSYPASDNATTLTYAPIALSGLAVTFAIDRNPDPFGTVPPEYAAAVNLPFTELKLTPRLLAKLLTNSYWGSLPPELDHSYLGPNSPENITKDKDFLAINAPEWAYQSLISPSLADTLMPQGRSDAARAVWSYIMADPDAAAFMAGAPDPYGMTVNPWYATDAAKNKSGSALELPRDDFPKADPAEVVPPQQSPINVVAWRPYVNDLDSAAYLTLRGDGQVLGPWDPTSAPAKYTKTGRSLPGFQRVLGISDAPASERYEVRVASLRNPAGEYVTPTSGALLAAASAMSPAAGVSGVAGLDLGSAAARASKDAYPLALPVYAAADPALLSAPLRADYAAFIRYAAGAGQASGVALGQLPPGYASLPSSWVTAATAAADAIERGPAAPTAAPTPSDAAPASSAGAPRSASSAVAASASTTVQPATTPALGVPANALAGAVTPRDPETGAIAVAVPSSLVAGALGTGAVPLVSRLRRRVP